MPINNVGFAPRARENGHPMPRFLDMLASGRVSADPVSVLFHYVRGEMVNWVNGKSGAPSTGSPARTAASSG
jgi:hypothetical protein